MLTAGTERCGHSDTPAMSTSTGRDFQPQGWPLLVAGPTPIPPADPMGGHGSVHGWAGHKPSAAAADGITKGIFSQSSVSCSTFPTQQGDSKGFESHQSRSRGFPSQLEFLHTPSPAVPGLGFCSSCGPKRHFHDVLDLLPVPSASLGSRGVGEQGTPAPVWEDIPLLWAFYEKSWFSLF